MDNLAQLTTEQANPATSEIDLLEGEELARTLHSVNFGVAEAVAAALPEIGRAIEAIAERLREGGRLFYVGAGSSGRIGVLDASECPPTFGVPHEMVQGVIAGGSRAVTDSIEGAEDDPIAGAADLQDRLLTSSDIVVGIAASGRTPYVIGALRYARDVGALTITIVNVRPSAMESEADIAIAAVTGPEAVTGSTRLKAGSAQKMICNLLSSGAMVRLGKTYGNLMVDVRASNEKLKDRATRIVIAGTGCDQATASAALESADWSAKTAIVMIRKNLPATDAEDLLEQSGGSVRLAFDLHDS